MDISKQTRCTILENIVAFHFKLKILIQVASHTFFKSKKMVYTHNFCTMQALQVKTGFAQLWDRSWWSKKLIKISWEAQGSLKLSPHSFKKEKKVDLHCILCFYSAVKPTVIKVQNISAIAFVKRAFCGDILSSRLKGPDLEHLRVSWLHISHRAFLLFCEAKSVTVWSWLLGRGGVSLLLF